MVTESLLHHGEIVSKFFADGWTAECSCGWRSEEMATSEAAHGELTTHQRRIARGEPEYAYLQARVAELEAILREARAGYDEFYESGNNARLLNVESRIRGLQPPLGVGPDGV